MAKNIESTVRKILIAHLKKRGVHSMPGDKDRLISGGFIDSLGAVELVSAIEKSFGITILPEEMTEEYFDSIDALSQLIASKRRK